jgi:phosphoribosylformylglycinamidine synthase
MPDWQQSLTMDLKRAGNLLVLVGDFQPAFGGSHFNLTHPKTAIEEGVPTCSPLNPRVYSAFYQAVTQCLIAACHDLSEGGLAVAAAEMVIGGRLGAKLDMGDEPDALRTVFGETSGCLLVEITPDHLATFRSIMKVMPYRLIGTVGSNPALQIVQQGKTILDVNMNSLLHAWKDGIANGQEV